LSKERQVILHVIPYAVLGGTEKDCYYFIKAGIAFRHVVWVLHVEGPMSSAWKAKGAEVVHLDILKYSLLRFSRALAKLSRPKSISAVFYWSTIRLPIIRHFFKDCECRLAVHIGNPVSGSISTLAKNVVLSLLFPSSIDTKLFACSNHVARTVARDSYLKSFPCFVSMNPVEIPKANPYTLRIIKRSGQINIGMVARLDPIKDHITAIHAFSIISDIFSNSKLHLFGDGPLEKWLNTIVRQLALGQQVVFHGSVTDVYSRLRDLDLFIYATTMKEGLGNAVTEALANGLPVVASDLPMIREIDGGSGAITFSDPGNAKDFADKAIMLLKCIDLRREKSSKSFNRARQNFSPERYTRERLDYLID
jgi:glycosyltransferase involved in cell wall biosynthesis